MFAASGIGNPAAFEATLEALGAEIVGRARYADHQAYDEDLLADLGKKAAASGAEAIVTTQKDAVKWGDAPAGAPEALVLRVGIVFTSGEAGIRDLLRNSMRPASATS